MHYDILIVGGGHGGALRNYVAQRPDFFVYIVSLFFVKYTNLETIFSHVRVPPAPALPGHQLPLAMQRLVARMLRRKVLDTEPTHLLRTLGFWDLTA